MTDKTDYMRRLSIKADTTDILREGLKNIPGYTRVELGDELRRLMMLPADEDRFVLQAESNGEQIIVSHRRGDTSARTINVRDQDARGLHIPIYADEVVKLHEAIKQVPGISSEVIAANIDLVAPAA